jgi:hypothetical protein
MQRCYFQPLLKLSHGAVALGEVTSKVNKLKVFTTVDCPYVAASASFW